MQFAVYVVFYDRSRFSIGIVCYVDLSSTWASFRLVLTGRRLDSFTRRKSINVNFNVLPVGRGSMIDFEKSILDGVESNGRKRDGVSVFIDR